jgi:rubrerythrin
MGALEKIAYLKGLLDGLEIVDETQRKVYAAMVEALDSVAREVVEQTEMVEEMRDLYDELSDDLDQLDEDLETLEDDFYDVVGDEISEEDESEFDEIYDSVVCPKCGHVFYFEPGSYDADEMLQCPACGEKIAQSENK